MSELTARCMSLRYEASVNELVPSCTKKDPRFLKSMEKSGFRVWDRGTGWAELSKPSQLILSLKLEKNNLKIDIAPFFRNVLKRVTKNRGMKLAEVMPKMISVTKGPGNSYRVVEAELQAWLERAKLNR